jgi:hypothetical protein
MDPDAAPMVIFHQCMDTEWALWGHEGALGFAKLGFAVIRVRTENWRDLKARDVAAFRNPYNEQQTNQQMICAIMMRDVTAPIIEDITRKMKSGELPPDLCQWHDLVFEQDLDVVVPPDSLSCVPLLDVVAVTEASALPAAKLSPMLLRWIYRSYSEKLVWAGFNAWTRVTGSKLLLGEAGDFKLLQDVLSRLKVWRIDQLYKSFQNTFFTVVSGRNHIAVGFRDHISGCNDGGAALDAGMVGTSYQPSPVVHPCRTKKSVASPTAEMFIRASLESKARVRGFHSWEDTVARRMWSYIPDADPLKQDRSLQAAIEAHTEDVRIVVMAKHATKMETARKKLVAGIGHGCRHG